MMSVRSRWAFGIGLALLLAACSPQGEQKKEEQKSEPTTAAPAQPATPPAAQPAAPKFVIRDGIGVGGIELGMTPADVAARLGKPDHVNKAGDKILFMAFHEPENFGVYFGDGDRVRMLIVSFKQGVCTEYDVCLYREGDLAKLKAHHGQKLLRFVDRDGSITYRMLEKKGDKQIMTEYTPSEEHNGVVQVAILYWMGKIDTSSFD